MRSANEWRNVVLANPFVKQPGKDESFFYVTFLADTPAENVVEEYNLQNYLPEESVFTDRYVYLYLPYGAGKAKLTNNILETKLVVESTIRIW